MAMQPALAADLVRLLLLWPEPMASDADAALSFHEWLQETARQSQLSEPCTLDELRAFFLVHGGVVAACRAAGAAASPAADERGSARVRLLARGFLVVEKSADHPASVGAVMGGSITDVSETGIGLETDVSLARGSVVRVVVAAPNPPLKVYSSPAHVRWCSGAGGRHQAGLHFHGGDEAAWRRDFLASFLPR